MAVPKLFYFLLIAALVSSCFASPPPSYSPNEDLDDDETLIVDGQVLCYKYTSKIPEPIFGVTVTLIGPLGFSKSDSTTLYGNYHIKGGSYKNAHLYRVKVNEFTLPYTCNVLAIPNPGALNIPKGVIKETAHAEVSPFIYI